MPYIGNQPFGKTVRTVTTETITSAKTAYYPNGGYMAGYVDVYVNGVRLSESLDFTATDGSLVTLLYSPSIGDTVEIVTYGSVEIANAVRRSGDTFSGNVYVGSNVYISTSTISVGNATVNTQITAGNIALNGSTLTIGNSTVNTVFTGDTVTVGGTLSLGNTAITGTANVTTAINVGANVSMNTTSIRVGNSTVNTYMVSDTIYGPSTLYIDPAAAGDNTGLVIVKGDLQVDGTTFTINSANVTVNDKNVVLASGAINNAATDGAGLTIYGTNANLTYNATGNNFEMSRGLSITGTANVSVGLNVGANVNLSTSQINVGNSTVNTAITSTTITSTALLSIGNTNVTGTANVSTGINIGANVNLSTTYMDVGNSTVNTTITNITVSTNTVNVASIINVGANVNLSTSQINVGNSTVNTVISAASLTTTSNTVSIGTAAYVVANGNVGVGTSSPGSKLDILRSSTTTTAFDESLIRAINTGAATLNQRVDIAMRFQDGTYNGTGGISMIRESATARSGGLSFSSIGSDGNSTNAMRLDSSGNLGLGVTPSAWGTSNKAIDVASYVSFGYRSATNGTVISNNTYLTSGDVWTYKNTAAASAYQQMGGVHYWAVAASGTAGTTVTGFNSSAMALDASGNLGIGVTPGAKFQVALTGTASLAGATIVKSTDFASTARAGFSGLANNNDGIYFGMGADGSGIPAGIGFFREASGWNTALTFYTNNVTSGGNGTAAMQEKVRIDSAGNLLVGTTSADPVATNVVGISFEGPYGSGKFSRSSNPGLDVNRKTNDGELVRFYQDGTQEGNITVSGTTVSYNGGHLSRSAQTTAPKDNTLVKGTVLSNLDEMNVYTKDGQPVDNEQLNKVKVSDTEGDANVAGVFVNWSYDEVHSVDEINMAMTGDMIIRIAQGTTVQRGDLLMSAGDGTAKPQGDDIVRSMTVAKVTSNHVTCTYADGSYCVPCVIMAC